MKNVSCSVISLFMLVPVVGCYQGVNPEEGKCGEIDCGIVCEIDNCDSPPLPEDVGGPCEAGAPVPSLPFPFGTHMGVTRGPGCEGHQGKLEYGFDFNVQGPYETSNDLVAVASSNGTVVKVFKTAKGGCLSKSCMTAEYNGGWGNCVVLKVDDTCLFERYCHLDVGGVFVDEGAHVCRGTPLGLIGSTGYSSGPHLHWQRERMDGQSVPVSEFAEGVGEIEGCNPCAIPDNKSGCYGSQNTELDQCAPPPVSPCAGLIDGKYCGSNEALQGYSGQPFDLVTCKGGVINGVVACTSGCQENVPGVNDECKSGDPMQMCGNGSVEPGEQCDGADLGGATCQGQGHDGGNLGCNRNCYLDVSQCCDSECAPGTTMCSQNTMQTCAPTGDGCDAWGNAVNCPGGCAGDVCQNNSCGNGAIDGGEQCDGGNLGGATCSSLGFSDGSLGCNNASCTFDTTGCCKDQYSVSQYDCYNYSSANGGGAGGGELFEVCGDVDPTSGAMTVSAMKYDGSVFGSRPYQVRVSSAGDPECGPATSHFIEVDKDPVGVGGSTLTFSFQANFQPGQTSKHYCVTASTKAGDVGYDSNSSQQKSWWWSEKIVVNKICQ